MANPRRILRLQKLLQEILGETLQREVEDPQLELATITRVKLNSDLMNATVFWSCLAKEKGRERAAAAMERVLPLLQARVASTLQIRVTPRLDLQFDPSLEHAQRLESIFHQLQEERGDDEDPETGDEIAEDGSERPGEDDGVDPPSVSPADPEESGTDAPSIH